MKEKAFDRPVAVEAQQPFFDAQHLQSVVGGNLSQTRLASARALQDWPRGLTASNNFFFKRCI